MSDVGAEADRLNAALEAFEGDLVDMFAMFATGGGRVVVAGPEVERAFELGLWKMGKGRQLQVRIMPDGSWIPLRDCTLAMRCEATRHLQALVEAMYAAELEIISATQAAAERVERLREELRKRRDCTLAMGRDLPPYYDQLTDSERSAVAFGERRPHIGEEWPATYEAWCAMTYRLR